MNARIAHVFTAVLAASALPVAFADFGPLPPGVVAQELVTEPTASDSRTSGPIADLANEIAQELNSEPSLKDTKITVQPGGGAITLTGSVSTKAQAEKAVEIAAARAGAGKVINSLQADEL